MRQFLSSWRACACAAAAGLCCRRRSVPLEYQEPEVLCGPNPKAPQASKLDYRRLRAHREASARTPEEQLPALSGVARW